MQKFLWTLTLCSSLLATAFFIVIELDSTTILQQTAGAAVSIAMAVIPYALARAVQELKKC